MKQKGEKAPTLIMDSCLQSEQSVGRHADGLDAGSRAEQACLFCQCCKI